MSLPKFDLLGKVASQALIEEGAFCHLMYDGNLLYRDPETKQLPLRAKVRSQRSKVYRDRSFALNREIVTKSRKARASEREEILQAEVRLEVPRRFAAVLVGLENCSETDPGYILITEDEAVLMAQESSYQWMLDQVLAFSGDDSNYGGDLGNGEAPPGTSGG